MSHADKALEQMVEQHQLSPREMQKMAAKLSAMMEILVELGLVSKEDIQQRTQDKLAIIHNNIRKNIQRKKEVLS